MHTKYANPLEKHAEYVSNMIVFNVSNISYEY